MSGAKIAPYTASKHAVLYMASLPLDANVLTMMVMTTKMQLFGHG